MFQSVVAMPTATTKLHILSIKKNLENNKNFLKTIAKCKTGKQCKRVINQATKNQLTTLQLLLSAFVRGDIEVSKQFHNQVKKSKKYNLITQHFAKIKSKKSLKENLLQVAVALPIFIKFILKKPRVAKQ